MSSETGERRPTSLNPTGPRPQEPENLPCPRCDSTNTKFCYYNNYNLSQPRHFCKSCRRYWTRGGTLRNVPVGGGTRKASTKRSRVSTRSATPTTTTSELSPSSSTVTHVVSNPISIIPGIKPETGLEISLFGHTDLNQTEPQSVGPFTSLLNTHGGGVGLPWYGLGLASGYHTMGYGLSMTDWPMEEVGEVNNVGGIGVSSEDGDSAAATMAMTTSSSNTWHIGGGEGGLADGDFFAWPNLAISSPSERLK